MRGACLEMPHIPATGISGSGSATVFVSSSELCPKMSKTVAAVNSHGPPEAEGM